MTPPGTGVTAPRISSKATAFTSGVSKKLRDQGYIVANARGRRKTNELPDLVVMACLETYCGLPTCSVRLVMDHTGVIRQKDIFAVKHMLIDLGYAIIENANIKANVASFVIAPRTVQVIEVPSSDKSRPDYSVRLENGKPIMCGCKGFAYRLHCRHLAVAATLAAKPAKAS